MLDWTEGHNTGIAAIDDLNKSFYHQLNEFLQANVEGRGKELVAGLLEFLRDYASKHIQIQERYINNSSYSEKEAHIDEHLNFQEEIKRIQNIFNVEGVTSTMVLELQSNMGEWFVNHIGIKDKKMANALRV